MPVHSVIVIGASAGGLEAVRTVLNRFPEKFPAAVFVVIHTSPDSPGMLATILDRVAPAPVSTPRDGETIRPGHSYVAPPDHHLVIDGSRIRVSHGPREHRFRPAIDPLFRSAAEHYGAGAIGIILSGHMADGAHGLMVIKESGGVAIVQNPDQAQVPSMPLSAMRAVKVDHVLPVEEMAGAVMELLMKTGARHRTASTAKKKKPRAEAPSPEQPSSHALQSGAMKGSPAPFTCPDCGGSLWELKEHGLVRYRCHVGHGFTAESLLTGNDDKLEETLWSALRAIEELIELRNRMLERAKGQHLDMLSSSLEREIAELQERATTLRRLLLTKPAAMETRKRSRKQKVNGRKAS